MLFIRQLDCGGCAPCPTGPCQPSSPPEATVYFRSASASLSKCGFTEWTGYESTPPKYFYYLNLGGTVTLDSFDAGCSTCITEVSWRYYGSASYNDALTCEETGVPSVNIKTYQNCSSIYSDETYFAFDVITAGLVGNGFTESYSSITHSIAGTNNCTSGNVIGSGSAYAAVNTEYTTSDLISNVSSIIPSFSGPWDSYNPATDYAYFDVSSDEVTATKTKLEYYLAWEPSLPSGGCLKITWQEKFTAEAGYAIYTAMTYVWNGSATYTGIYTINAPSTEGQTTVVSVAVTCYGC
jgi:hypothetical protein